MVSSSTAKQQRTHEDAASRLSKGSSVVVTKTLAAQKFYLDVKNALASAELERKIKELGGCLELFLIKEVTLVVTDRRECLNGIRGVGSHPRTPQTPTPHSNQPQDASSELHVTPRGRPKTRADEMLERVRKTPAKQQQPATVHTGDILDQAKAWRVPIWSVDKTLAWLNQLLADCSSSSSSSSSKKGSKCKVVQLKAPYVKFEAFGRLQRPVFKEIPNWPFENVTGAAGSAAVLQKPPAGAQMMTKSQHAIAAPAKVDATVPQSGYCEICRTEYANLRVHLDSKKHLLFVTDNANYIDLDTLIANVADLNTFLADNGGAQRNGVVVDGRKDCAPALHKMPKTRISAIHECNGTKVKNGHVSPTESDFRLMRARKSSMTYIALTKQPDDDDVEPLPILHGRELRSKTAKIQDNTWKSGRPKRACINRKRPTYLDDAILASEQRGFYKMEMTPKVAPDDKKASVQFEQQLDGEKSLMVKFKRMRSSELRQLNDEAENFLFPKVKDESSSEDIDTNRPDTTVSSNANDSMTSMSSEQESREENKVDDEEHDEKKRKRLTQAEAFIEDNKKYYKFETPDTRLRYHGSLPNEPAAKRVRRNGEATHDGKREDSAKPDDGKFTLDELQFSFERVPKSEPWYETYSRQDNGAEYYTCFSDSGYWKKIVLPYEMDRIAPLDPKVCIQTYTQIKKIFASELSSGSNSGTCSTSDCSAQGSPAPCVTDECANNAVQNERGDKPPASVLSLSRKKRELGNNPRKSPRQHASTLAILSSLIQHRKKRKSNSTVNNALSVIPESAEVVTVEQKPESEATNINQMAESIDEMLANAFIDLDDVEVPTAEHGIGFVRKSDAIEVLEDYDNRNNNHRKPAKRGRKTLSPGRKAGRKRKKNRNRTGWPKHSTRRANVSRSNVAVKVTVKQEKIEGEEVQTSANCHEESKHLSAVEADDGQRWDDKVLSTKTSNNAIVDVATPEKNKRNRRMQGSSSPSSEAQRHLAKRARRMPASPKSPRVLRKPRGRWYRER